MRNYKVNRAIYAIRNKDNGKMYIGKDDYYPHRFYDHRGLLINNKHYNRHLQFAWNKYGEEIFEFIPLMIFGDGVSKEELSLQEIEYIKEYDSVKSGYNLSYGGEGGTGIPCSEEKKLKISNANKGKIRTDAQKDRIKQGVRRLRKEVFIYKDGIFLESMLGVRVVSVKYKINYCTLKGRIKNKVVKNGYLFTNTKNHD